MSEGLLAYALCILAFAWAFGGVCFGFEKMAKADYYRKLAEDDDEGGDDGDDENHYDPDDPQDWWKKEKVP